GLSRPTTTAGDRRRRRRGPGGRVRRWSPRRWRAGRRAPRDPLLDGVGGGGGQDDESLELTRGAAVGGLALGLAGCGVLGEGEEALGAREGLLLAGREVRG